MNLSIIIFFYNEDGGLLETFENTFTFLSSFANAFEIILINDGSTDKSSSIAIEIEGNYPFVSVIHHDKNKGIGMALRSGYQAAKYDYICAVPGDGQFNITELSIVSPFLNDTYYSFYRPITNYSFYRKLLSWFNRLFNQHILAIYLRDVNWIKVYRKDQLNRVSICLESSLIESEICAKLYKLGIMPTEVPSAYLERKSGKAKGGNWKTLSMAISETFLLWSVVARFRK